MEWIRVRDVPLTDVKHLQQKIKTPIGEVEMKEIGALTDGQPIEEQNALELKKKFDQRGIQNKHRCSQNIILKIFVVNEISLSLTEY